MGAIIMVEAKPICVKILVRHTMEVATRVLPAMKFKPLVRLAPKFYPTVLCHVASLATMIANNLMS